MKTKIATMTFAVILSVSLLNAQEESYLPVFGEGTTRFYAAFEMADGPGQLFYFECNKNIENEKIYHLNGFSFSVPYRTFEISEDNSKLWGHYTYIEETYTDLLMDLNLNIGDDFKGFTVAKVYHKDGRKHIEFEEEISKTVVICVDENNFVFRYEIPFMFIEGIGPNAFVEYHNVYVPWIYAQYRDGELEYGFDGYLPWEKATENNCYNTPDGIRCDTYLTCKDETGIKETNIRTLMLVPNPSGDKVQVTLPETITKKTVLTVSDLSGRIIETVTVNNNSFVLDISRYAPAIYIAKININNYRYIGKIIKK